MFLIYAQKMLVYLNPTSWLQQKFLRNDIAEKNLEFRKNLEIPSWEFSRNQTQRK